MNGYEAYISYLKIKVHFYSDGFNAAKFAKSKATPESYSRRKDQRWFEIIGSKFSKREEFERFLIACHVYQPHTHTWVGDLTKFSDLMRSSHRLEKNINKADYIFKEDVIKIHRESQKTKKGFAEALLVYKNKYPLILDMMLKNKISIETIIILDKTFNLIDMWVSEISDRLIWPDIYRVLAKYKQLYWEFDQIKKYDFDKIFKLATEAFLQQET